MTVEQADQRALAATRAGDLVALGTALAARAQAIAALSFDTPSPALAKRLAAAFESGKLIEDALRALKLRLSLESSRLAQLRDGFRTILRAPDSPPRIDFQG